MKKYQLWLERKSYSQHLFNLMKIKRSTHLPFERPDQTGHVRRLSPNYSPNRQHSTLSRVKELEQFHQDASKLGDITYAITFKQLKNHKLRLMRSFQILNENMSMARRVKQVKSVLTTTLKDKTNSEHFPNNRRRLFEKKCELSNDDLREQNFRKFMKFHNNKTANHHNKYLLNLTIEALARFMHSHNQYAAAWCEIYSQKGIVRSQLVHLQNLQGHQFCFPLEYSLPKDCLVSLFICKGLKSQLIGEIPMQRPEIGETTTKNYLTKDGQFQIKMRLNYQKSKRQRFIFNMK